MGNTAQILQNVFCFKDKNQEDISRLLENLLYRVKDYGKNELIAAQGESAEQLGIVLQGQVEVQKIYPNGKNMTIARIDEGQPFGEAVLFSREPLYPATILASIPSKVLYIGKREMLKLFASDPDILLSYMENMSDRLIMLNRKIEILSLGSLRRQIAFELLKMADKQQTDTVTLPYSKRVWAEHLNVTRPSLSREIGSMRDQGIISFSGNRITLVDRRAVEEILD
ncbi:Crp/Fnr family transcriptional regulator [Paenibacillus sp. URB8-2]|uniref:Crp/Fnr family transcriptional regulator n=1 Tax=Paenibacillus sp. URB8-2 TaxID=2741301 RepID=UPI0015BFE558|nr:Crp/Fnr family transcriptional regulator [Paenibacillus sp. URB8-2]BCG59146.1 cAMP-binding protein [Paenibacillus sp. URB8-2]